MLAPSRRSLSNGLLRVREPHGMSSGAPRIREASPAKLQRVRLPPLSSPSSQTPRPEGTIARKAFLRHPEGRRPPQEGAGRAAVRRVFGEDHAQTLTPPRGILWDISACDLQVARDLGYSQASIEKASEHVVSECAITGAKPTLDCLLDALSALQQNGSGMALMGTEVLQNQVLGAQSVIEEELVLMGFPLEHVRSVLAALGEDASIHHAMDALIISAHSDSQNVTHASSRVAAPENTSTHISSMETSHAILNKVMSKGAEAPNDLVMRLLFLGSAAVRQGLMTEDQLVQFHDEVQSGDPRIFQELQEFLRLIRVRNEPSMPLLEEETTWECCICFSEQETCGWSCPSDHQYCHTCMRHHAEATVLPRCPFSGCGYELEEPDLVAINVTSARLQQYKQTKLDHAINALSTGSDQLVKCPNVHCSNAMVVPTGSCRCQFACSCGEPPFCTRCRQAPYHYHAECTDVQTLRQSWLDWVSGGREKYFGDTVRYCQKVLRFEADAKEYSKQVEALREGLKRFNELERDEQWKVKQCRCCPSCKRPIQKIDGCNSMLCGENYHGGSKQDGCGAKFNWEDALPYTAEVRTFNASKPVAPQPAGTCQRGIGVFHPFSTCGLCGVEGFEGPLFQCIHCEHFVVCSICESKLSSCHSANHVFKIFFESEFDWKGVPLPLGTPVRIVRRENVLPPSHGPDNAKPEGLQGTVIAFDSIRGTIMHRRAIALGEEPPCGTYRIRLRMGLQIVEYVVSAMFVEPLITSKSEADELIKGAKGRPANHWTASEHDYIPGTLIPQWAAEGALSLYRP